ncbi:MAG: ABC transporter ATP-binding protein [Candidatus Altiarchaeota archaeon]
MSEGEYFVSADNLSKRYGEKYAVKNLSFNVRKNEIFGFIGPNGAGKTTTLKVVSGIITPSEGECIVSGLNVIHNRIEVKELVGYLPEEDYLYGEMNLSEHLRYIGELYGVQNLDSAVSEILKLVDLDDTPDKVIKTMSKGQRRRAAIAKTLVHNPELVILDELTSGLDPVSSRKMFDTVKDLKDRGKTIIFSTHTLDEAVRLCDRILIIDEGEQKAIGTVEEILAQTGKDSLEDSFFYLVG